MLRGRIETIIGGPVVRALSQPEGWSPGSADRVATTDGRRAFVKTLSRSRNPFGFGLHEREARVMAALPEKVSAPRLLGVARCETSDDEWIGLVFQDVPGRHPGGEAEAAEIPVVLDTLARLPRSFGALSALPSAASELAHGFAAWPRLLAVGLPGFLPGEIVRAAERLAEAAELSPSALEGSHLVHVDCRADNLLVDDQGRVWMIDWPWAAIGPRWLDSLTYLLDVRVRGQRVDVESIVAMHPVFSAADPAHIDAVLAAMAGMFLEKATHPEPANISGIRDFRRREGLAAADWLLRRWAG